MKKFSFITIFITLAICLGYTVQTRWKGESGDAWRSIINSDGYGYYAYLPCIFIYHKFDYNRALVEELKVCPSANGFLSPLPGNKFSIKCFSGLAILLLPFFLIAYLLSYLLGYSLEGYGLLFQVSVSIGALFYLGLGLVFLYKLLKKYNISEFIACSTLILIAFGTNLFYYSTGAPSMSHVYSFGLSAAFLFYTKKAVDEFKLKNLIPMVISITILVMIRPTNIFNLVFVPFLAGSLKDTISFIKRFFESRKTFLLFVIAGAIFFIQFFLWYLQSGHFFLWSYPGESFDFKRPHFFDILFSYRNGWFIYTPLMFIACLGGLVILFRQSIFRFLNALLFFMLVTYVLSSWWAWWYGGAFGLRAYIDFYPIFAIFLAIFLNSLTSLWLKIPVLFLCLLCLGLNLFQTSQYVDSILPYSNMTKEKYWKIFLKNEPTYRFLFFYPDTIGFNFIHNYNIRNYFEQDSLANNLNITTEFAHSGQHSVFLNNKNQYSPIISLKPSMIPQAKNLVIYVKLWIRVPNFNNTASIVVDIITEKRECYFWSAQNLQGFVFKPNVWSEAYAIIYLPAFKNPSDKLEAYVFNTKGEVYIDDMEVTFGTPK